MGNQSRQSRRGLLQCKCCLYYCGTFVWILLNVMFTSNLPVQLISSVDPKFLKLTKMDDQIYKVFREGFKDFEIKLLKEEDLKSDKAKAVGVNVGMCVPYHQNCSGGLSVSVVFASQTWRSFCNQFEGLVEDFNYGTLLRLDCEGDYTEENTIFGACVRHLRSAFKESNSSLQHISCFQSPGFSSWRLRSPETERATTTVCSAPSKDSPPLTGFYENTQPTNFVFVVKFYCASYNSCLFRTNLNVA